MRISDEEKAMFRAAVSGARRIKPIKAPPRAAPPPAVARQSRADREAVLREMSAAKTSPDDDAYRQDGVSARVGRDLRAGRYLVQATLDLHGVRSVELSARLAGFLREARLTGRRCVRIVHGKGRNSPGREPVLRDLVRGFLRRREEVLAYCAAPDHDGGSGAMYVLLSK
jgi:DNA-nicking Smr family endonuclease